MNISKIMALDYLLIDTNFIIDSYLHPDSFKSFLEKTASNETQLLTIPQVKHEFVISRTKNLVLNKLKYFDKTSINLLNNVIPRIDKIAESLIIEYKDNIAGVSITDLYLGSLLKHQRGLKLITRDHKDFPTKIYSREDIINFHLPTTVLTYGIYSYGSKKQSISSTGKKIDDVPF